MQSAAILPEHGAPAFPDYILSWWWWWWWWRGGSRGGGKCGCRCASLHGELQTGHELPGLHSSSPPALRVRLQGVEQEAKLICNGALIHR